MAQTNLPSFSTSTNLGFSTQQSAPVGQGNSLFGGSTTQNSSLFGTTAATNQQNNTGFSFGNQNNQTGSLFGATQPATQNTGFTTGSLFGSPQQTPSFGQTTTPQPAFGGNQQSGSLFGAQPTGSLFGAQQASPQTQAPSAFGTQQTGSLFGTQPTGSLFGAQPITQQTPSLWGAQPTPHPQQTSLGQQFVQPAYGQTPQGGFFGAMPQMTAPAPAAPPAPGSMFSQLSLPLVSQAQNIQDQNNNAFFQMATALALAVQNQSQQSAQTTQATPEAGNNNALEVFSKMLANFSQNNNDPNKKLLSDTPFDEYMNEARK